MVWREEMNKKLSVLITVGLSASLVACSSVSVEDLLPETTVAYKKARQARENLEVPPDLTSRKITDRMAVPATYSGTSSSYSEFKVDQRARGNQPTSAANRAVLPKLDDVAVQRDGDVRWLTINANPDEVWDSMLGFWEEQGILISEQDPNVGIMVTAWVENRANIRKDIVSNTLRKALDGLYDSGMRDSYRIRLEEGQAPGTTEIYLTHYGMEEQINSGLSGRSVVWQARPRDLELEVEMLNRMMVYLGVSEEKAKARLAANQNRKSRAQMLKTRDGVQLNISESFSRSWRLVGLALDRVGFAVYDRDRSTGTYYVRYYDPAADADGEGGFFSKLKFWGDEKDREVDYQIRVTGQGERSFATVHNAQGERLLTDTATRILNLVFEQVR